MGFPPYELFGTLKPLSLLHDLLPESDTLRHLLTEEAGPGTIAAPERPTSDPSLVSSHENTGICGAVDPFDKPSSEACCV